MSVDACAAMVARSDPDRFASAMTAPMHVRGDLMVLYAFNLEVARAPWVTSEPLLAEMRMQWWTDTLEEIATGKPARAHEVAGPLSEMIRRHALPTEPLRALISARRLDVDPGPPEDWEALWRYLDAVAGGLMATAARVLGADERVARAAHRFGTTAGAARYIEALPPLLQAGHQPLPVAGEEGVATLARQALTRLERLRPPRATLPAFLAGWTARAVLKTAAQRPERALAGQISRPEAWRRLSLIRAVILGRL